MKKLMIVAALAAMTGAAFAEAQVYDVKLKVKTTACKSAKLSKALADLNWFPGVKKGDTVAFRGTASRQIAGVIWGCSCDALSRPKWNATNGGKGVGGYAFWDQTTSPYTAFQIPYVTFDWAVLNRVGQMKNVEGTWVLGDTAAGEAFYLMGAGFGTCTLPSNDCDSYVQTMSGNFAGFMEYNYTENDGCIFCGETSTDCLVAPFCICGTAPYRETTDVTVAYGTWQIKYNASQSNLLKKKSFITDVKNCTGKALAPVGAALKAAKAATLVVTGYATDSKPYDISKVAGTLKTSVTEVPAVIDLETVGSYYAKFKSEVTSAKLDAVETKNPGSVASDELPTVAAALIKSLGHVEAAASEEESGSDEEPGDDEDFGDDEDDWNF